jgi:vacuolar protein sorting-associated protein VTA1
MEGIDIPADKVPEGLKSCEQILKRAQEVKKVEPVVSYWCKCPFVTAARRYVGCSRSSAADAAGCFYAAQKALKVPKRSNADTALLMSLLDALEQVSWLTLHIHAPPAYLKGLS